ncbi:MAG TPA: AMP-binding protein [Pyrinomonadaceae bacterium]|nr:AMP-binding protein [Pyrinomonadaceae bacterium]
MKNGATTLNLASVIEHHARLAPQKEAVVWNEMRFSFGQLNALANRVANALTGMGIGYGDKVALSCPNLPFFPIVYYGIMKAGAAVVPLNVLFKPREIAYHLADSDAKAIFVFEGTPELPLAQAVKDGFDQVETCEHLIVMTIDPTAPCPFEDCKTLMQITFDKSEEFETYPTKPEDTCAILYTSGTTGQPKGAELMHQNLMMKVVTTY